MAKQKTWTAEDIKMNKLRLHLDSSNVLHVIQGYAFVDGDGRALDVFPDRSVEISVDWADVPQEVKDGLVAINDYMHNRALQKEGMGE